MTDQEVVDDLDALVKRHAGSLDPEDLRALAERLESTAAKWEALYQ